MRIDPAARLAAVDVGDDETDQWQDRDEHAGDVEEIDDLDIGLAWLQPLVGLARPAMTQIGSAHV